MLMVRCWRGQLSNRPRTALASAMIEMMPINQASAWRRRDRGSSGPFSGLSDCFKSAAFDDSGTHLEERTYTCHLKGSHDRGFCAARYPTFGFAHGEPRLWPCHLPGGGRRCRSDRRCCPAPSFRHRWPSQTLRLRRIPNRSWLCFAHLWLAASDRGSVIVEPSHEVRDRGFLEHPFTRQSSYPVRGLAHLEARNA